jgi:thioesterase domain-containing protein
MLKLPAALKKVRDACYTAARTYQPKPYDGAAVLFRASERGLSSIEQESAWKKLVPGIQIYEVAGHHGNIVDPPQVRFLAEEIQTCLDAAFAQRNAVVPTDPALLEVKNSEGQLEIA